MPKLPSVGSIHRLVVVSGRHFCGCNLLEPLELTAADRGYLIGSSIPRRVSSIDAQVTCRLFGCVNGGKRLTGVAR